MAYGVAHTSNLYGCAPFSFVDFVNDVQNGSLVAKGDLAPGEREIYECVDATASDPVFLVADPAWSYDDSRTVNQNEDNYIIKAGKAFRGYELHPNRKYRVSLNMLNGTPAVGSYLEMSGGRIPTVTASMPTGSGFIGKILALDTIGYPLYVGSPGIVDNTNEFALIEVIQNG